MAFTPTRISELNSITPELDDQVPIARGSSTTGRTYKVLIRDLIGSSWTTVDSQTINFSFDSTTVTLSADVVDNSITNLKLRDSQGVSVIGRSASSFGDPADIVAATNGQVLRVNDIGNILSFGPVNLANPNAVTGVLPISAGGSGSSVKTNLVPVGAVMPMATQNAPVGWLFCDGSTIPLGTTGTFQGKPIADLQELRILLGTIHDPDGINVGRLPDLRGVFVRGYGTNGYTSTTLGRTPVTSGPFGVHQQDTFQGHKHGLYDPGHMHMITDFGHMHTITDPGHFHTIKDPGHMHTITDPGHTHTASTNTTGAHTHDINNQVLEGPEWIAFSRNAIPGGRATNPPPGPDSSPSNGYETDNTNANDRIFRIVSNGNHSHTVTVDSSTTGMSKTGTNSVAGSLEMTGLFATGNPQFKVEYIGIEKTGTDPVAGSLELTGLQKTGNHPTTGSVEPTYVRVQNPTSDSSDVGSGVGNSSGTAPRTSDETRPSNVALYYCIKY